MTRHRYITRHAAQAFIYRSNYYGNRAAVSLEDAGDILDDLVAKAVDKGATERIVDDGKPSVLARLAGSGQPEVYAIVRPDEKATGFDEVVVTVLNEAQVQRSRRDHWAMNTQLADQLAALRAPTQEPAAEPEERPDAVRFSRGSAWEGVEYLVVYTKMGDVRTLECRDLAEAEEVVKDIAEREGLDVISVWRLAEIWVALEG